MASGRKINLAYFLAGRNTQCHIFFYLRNTHVLLVNATRISVIIFKKPKGNWTNKSLSNK